MLGILQKTGKKFGTIITPTRIYESLIDDKYMNHFFDIFDSKDLIMYCLLVPYLNNGDDVDEIYDKIENNLFSIELVEIYNSEPEVDCPKCDGTNVIKCDNCNGDGRLECGYCDGIGDVDCDMCDGLGVDEEGDECHHCNMGKVTCSECRGNSDISCNVCGGDGEIYCDKCDNGKIVSEDESIVNYDDYVSWNPKWKRYFTTTSKDEVLDSEDINNFLHNKQTIRINYEESLSDGYQGFENGNVLLFRFRDTSELIFNKGVSTIRIG